MAVFPHGSDPRIVVVPMGDPPSEACEIVAESLRETFETPVAVGPAVDPPATPDPEEAVNDRWLEPLAPYETHADVIVGVTGKRLQFTPGENDSRLWIALHGGSRGIISTERLGDVPLSSRDRELLTKLPLTVVGILFGLWEVHREDSGEPCLVDVVGDFYGLDSVPDDYCDECWRALTDERDYPKPPIPDEWIVRSRVDEAVRTAGGGWSGSSLSTYPFIALGFVVVGIEAVWNHVRPPLERVTAAGERVLSALHPGNVSARNLPPFVHELYRTVRFWGNLGLYLTALLAVFLGLLSGYEWLLGSTPPDGIAVGLLVIGLVLAFPLVWFVKAIVHGFYAGLLGSPPEDLE